MEKQVHVRIDKKSDLTLREVLRKIEEIQAEHPELDVFFDGVEVGGDDQVEGGGVARAGGGYRVDPAVDGAVLGVHQLAPPGSRWCEGSGVGGGAGRAP